MLVGQFDQINLYKCMLYNALLMYYLNQTHNEISPVDKFILDSSCKVTKLKVTQHIISAFAKGAFILTIQSNKLTIASFANFCHNVLNISP